MTRPEELERLAALCEQGSYVDNTHAVRCLGREIISTCGKGYVSPLYAWLNPLLSVDAAMTLVPEQCPEWHAGKHHKGGGSAYLTTPWHKHGNVYVVAATPALALTAASLRAHASLSRMGEDRNAG